MLLECADRSETCSNFDYVPREKQVASLNAPARHGIERLMKKYILAAFVLLSGLYIYAPYRAAGKYRDAVNAGDTAALNTLVDYTELRKNLRERMTQSIPNDNRASATAKILGNAFADAMLNELVSPDSIGKLLAIGKLVNGTEPQKIESLTWAGITKVRVQLSHDKSGLIFQLTNSGWKLIDREMGFSHGQ